MNHIQLENEMSHFCAVKINRQYQQKQIVPTTKQKFQSKIYKT